MLFQMQLVPLHRGDNRGDRESWDSKDGFQVAMIQYPTEVGL